VTPRGRPRTFDREQALRRAIDVFWARGFDGATLEELQAAMGGIAPPSFYAAFGSKDQLFREAVQLYHATMSERIVGALQGASAREGIEGVLRAATEQFCSGDGPRGCLVLLGALNCTRVNKDAHDYLHELRQQGLDMIRQRLTRAVSEGDLPAGAPVSDMASFYTTVLHGLAVRAHDGASRQVLLAAVDAAMAAWDPLVGKTRPTARRRASAPRPRRRQSPGLRR
jgi:AcrR family transcriptional regulator